MNRSIGITLVVLSADLRVVTKALILVATGGNDQEVNTSTVITIGDIQQHFLPHMTKDSG